MNAPTTSLGRKLHMARLEAERKVRKAERERARRDAKRGKPARVKMTEAERKATANENARARRAANPEAARKKARERKRTAEQKARRAELQRARHATKAPTAEQKAKKAEADKAYYEANREKRAGYYKEWAAANPGKINANNAKRRAVKRQSFPSWVTPFDRRVMRLRHEWAAKIGNHVDHAIPLTPCVDPDSGLLLVTGLHVVSNLVIIEAGENIRKSNRITREELDRMADLDLAETRIRLAKEINSSRARRRIATTATTAN